MPVLGDADRILEQTGSIAQKQMDFSSRPQMTQPASVCGGIVLHVFFQVWPISHPVSCLSCSLTNTGVDGSGNVLWLFECQRTDLTNFFATYLLRCCLGKRLNPTDVRRICKKSSVFFRYAHQPMYTSPRRNCVNWVAIPLLVRKSIHQALCERMLPGSWRDSFSADWLQCFRHFTSQLLFWW